MSRFFTPEQSIFAVTSYFYNEGTLLLSFDGNDFFLGSPLRWREPFLRELAMSNFRRYLVLISASTLILAFLSGSPAQATFTTVCYITSSSLPSIRMQADPEGGVTFYVETPNGDGRFLQMRPGGGHWEIHMLHSLPDGTAMALDSEGYPEVILD
ncbi:MAG TPA: hypothetical protein VIE43_21725 [Thermoanaerobaculia bacterium]|jgi:hypothetical protein|nr:hypothetical protein [Thermoanaerobaculia bacterium]